MLNKTYVMGVHKLLQIVITEEPNFHCEIFQHFGTVISDNADDGYIPECRVMMGLTESEFNAIVKTLLDYVLEKQKRLEDAKQTDDNIETGDLNGD